MIVIDAPVVKTVRGNVRLTANLVIDGVARSLWFEVEDRFGQYLCFERADAFVLAVLHYAFKYGHSIKSEVPVTDRLYHQLTDQFLPAFNRANNSDLQIEAPIAPEVEHLGEQGVGTGCSCGVDSLHAFALHPEITHACVWNGHGGVADETSERREAAWQALRDRARAFSQMAGKQLIVGDTNFDGGCAPGMAWEGGTTNGNLFCVYALQKLWRHYYIASNGVADGFSLRVASGGSPAGYEYFLFPHLSLARMAIYMDGAAYNRVEKIRHLVSYAPAWKFLNVCHEITAGGENCTYRCSKCALTVMALFALNALDHFADVFDARYFNQHREEFLAEYWRGLLMHHPPAVELRHLVDSSRFTISERFRAAQIVFLKAFKKLLRGGTTKIGKFSSRG